MAVAIIASTGPLEGGDLATEMCFEMPAAVERAMTAERMVLTERCFQVAPPRIPEVTSAPLEKQREREHVWGTLGKFDL